MRIGQMNLISALLQLKVFPKGAWCHCFASKTIMTSRHRWLVGRVESIPEKNKTDSMSSEKLVMLTKPKLKVLDIPRKY